ncbi:MAG: Flagellar hook-length control protein FliK, partial [Frankiales bacterium]|nr:Flagellar hook-length control protein FliK [Frankiales bacterium]
TALARLAADSAPAQVRPAVAELARGLRDAGGGRASLVVRLDPPELGPVVVRLTVRDGRVDVQLRTSEAVASVGLAAAGADVRSTLAQHGLDLSSFDVQQGDAQDAPAGGRASSDQATPERRGGADRSTSTPRARVVRDATPDPATGGTAGAWL